MKLYPHLKFMISFVLSDVEHEDHLPLCGRVAGESTYGSHGNRTGLSAARYGPGAIGCS